MSKKSVIGYAALALRHTGLSPDEGGHMGYPNIDVVAFNVDGGGTALLRVYYDRGDGTNAHELQLHAWDADLESLLGGDPGDGSREYEEQLAETEVAT